MTIQAINIQAVSRIQDVEGYMAIIIGVHAIAILAVPVQAFSRIQDVEGYMAITIGVHAIAILAVPVQTFSRIQDVEGHMRDHCNMHHQNLPNVWGSVMHSTVDLFILMTIIGFINRPLHPHDNHR